MRSVLRCLIAVLSLVLVGAAQAAPATHGTILVFGDSLGDGLHAGLYQLFKDSTGLARANAAGWGENAAAAAIGPDVIAAVFMFGTNDLFPVWIDRKTSADFGTGPWRAEYARRAKLMTEPFRLRGIKTYWVGLPIVRRVDRRESYQIINAVLQDAARTTGTPFFDEWLRFTKDGEFSSYWEDPDGNPMRLRADDGIHFTAKGYVELARPVARAIGQELGLAAFGASH